MVDGLINVELVLCAVLGGEPLEDAESHLELSNVQHIVISEVFKIPFPCYTPRGALAAGAADPYAVVVQAVVAVGGDALGANELVAAVVLPVLVFQNLAEPPFHFGTIHVPHFFCDVFFAVVPQDVAAGVVDPIHHLLGDVLLHLPVLVKYLRIVEELQESLSEFVIVRFRFAQNGHAQLIEPSHGGAMQPQRQRFTQGQPFLHRNVQTFCTQIVEECVEHSPSPHFTQDEC